ncbi:YpjP-like protein OS=Ureibacillus acetophenoni OX=614649 GN=SAMN05877842_103223 PE=4 SV=1 [Ureibacillus acetophenoni]
MKKWLQKMIVIFVAFITFGIISPSHEIWELLDQDQSENSKSDISEHSIAEHDDNHSDTDEQSIESIFEAAKAQSYLKFGTRIAPFISDEFESTIFPKMEEVIESTIAKMNYESYKYINITEQPSGNYSEKIFNLSDGLTGKDLIRFHVRTEKRPLEGYYYNFHYHTYEDRFVTHHDMGDIYWSKNTPPKWLS